MTTDANAPVQRAFAPQGRRGSPKARRRFGHVVEDLLTEVGIGEAYKTRQRFGLDVVGYLLSEIGLGEAARLLVGALDATEIPTRLVNVPLPGRQADDRLAERLAASEKHAAALSIFGLIDLRTFADRASRHQVNIAYPYWELPTAPSSVRPIFDRFDAYWAPTTFIRDMLTAEQDRPVRLIPQPIRLSAQPPPALTFDGPLRVLSFFDYDSVMTRKNPLGAVQAFMAAFPTANSDVQLVIKARGSLRAEAQERLYELIECDPRIVIIDETLTREGMDALMASCHVFLSLHRSEGFGLGCAEALASGKIVVATNFGGPRDMITPATGYPVAFRPVRLAPDDYPESEGSYWAEPDVSHAAEILRAIYDRPAEAAAKPLAGYAYLRANHSFEVVGAKIAEALRELG